LASFKRDLFREPMNIAVKITGEADSLVEMFTLCFVERGWQVSQASCVRRKK